MLKHSSVLLIALGFIYFLTRFWNLTNLPIFVDEANYLRWTIEFQKSSNWWFSLVTDGKEPLFFWVQSYFLRFFSDPLVGGRSLAVISGFGIITGIYFLAKELFGKTAAFFASLFYLTSPFAFFYNRLALLDSFLTLFLILTLTFLVYGLKRNSLLLSVLAGIGYGLALWTKSIAEIYLFLPFVVLLTIYPKRNWKLFFIFIITSVLIFLPLVLRPDYIQVIAKNNNSFAYSLQYSLNHWQTVFYANFKMAIKDWFVAYFGLLSIIGVIVLSFWALIKKNANLIAIVLLFWLPLLSEAFIAKIFFPRYLFFLIVPVAVISGIIFQRLVSIFKPVFLGYGIVLLFLLIPTITTIKLLTRPETANLPVIERWQYFESWPSGYGVQEVAGQLKSLVKNGRITVSVEGLGAGDILKYDFSTSSDVKLITITGKEVQPFGDYLVLSYMSAPPALWNVNEIGSYCKVECKETVRVYKINRF